MIYYIVYRNGGDVMSKTKGTILFRLNDLNGAVAEVILQTAVRQKIRRVVECTPETISGEIEKFLNEGEFRNYSKVYIIGSRFEKRLADRITDIMLEEEIEFVYRDHHRESLDLSKYLWGRVLLFDANSNPISSAKNLYRELVKQENPRYIRLSLLIDMANASITGYVPLEDEAGKAMIEELYNLAGSPSKFAESMIEKIMSDDAFFNEADIIAKIEAEKRAKEEAEEEMRVLKEKLRKRNTGWW